VSPEERKANIRRSCIITAVTLAIFILVMGLLVLATFYHKKEPVEVRDPNEIIVGYCKSNHDYMENSGGFCQVWDETRNRPNAAGRIEAGWGVIAGLIASCLVYLVI
jgi:hypothetical protein